MDTQGPHHPDERDAWFRGEAPAAFPASRRPPAPGSWTPEADPLTGPLPPESDVRASLAEAQEEASRANPAAAEPLGGAPVSSPTGGFETYQPGLVRQHAERVPRYIPPAQSGPVSAPPSSAPPVSAAPAVEPQAEQPAQEPGIPASLAPMLSHDDSGYAPQPPQEQYTEPLSRAALAEAAPQQFDPPQQFDAPQQFDPPQPLDAPPVDASAGEQEPSAVPSFPPAPEFGGARPQQALQGAPPQQAASPQGVPQQTAPQQIVSSPGASGAQRMPAPQAQPTAYQSLGSQPDRSGGGNAAVLAAVVLCTLLATAPSVLLLYRAALDGPGISAAGVVAATLMLIGLPMLAAGLYPLLSGGVPGAPHEGWRVLLRPPLAYLPVGLILLLAAGLAAG